MSIDKIDDISTHCLNFVVKFTSEELNKEIAEQSAHILIPRIGETLGSAPRQQKWERIGGKVKAEVFGEGMRCAARWLSLSEQIPQPTAKTAGSLSYRLIQVIRGTGCHGTLDG